MTPFVSDLEMEIYISKKLKFMNLGFLKMYTLEQKFVTIQFRSFSFKKCRIMLKIRFIINSKVSLRRGSFFQYLSSISSSQPKCAHFLRLL